MLHFFAFSPMHVQFVSYSKYIHVEVMNHISNPITYSSVIRYMLHRVYTLRKANLYYYLCYFSQPQEKNYLIDECF